jgi:hypothetical protein
LDPQHCPWVTFDPALEPGQPGGQFLERVRLKDGQVQAEQTGVGRVVRQSQLNTLLSPAPNCNEVTVLVWMGSSRVGGGDIAEWWMRSSRGGG